LNGFVFGAAEPEMDILTSTNEFGTFMVSTQTFNDIIQAAIAAPSPDNNQPWLFRVENDSLLVYLDHSRSLPSDVKSMFDMTSIGAAVENAVIAAAQQGYAADVKWCSPNSSTDLSNNSPAIEIKLHAGGSPDPLFAAIHQRCTNRKFYESEPLDPSLLEQLAAACAPFPEVQVDWLSSKDEKRRFGKLIASTDALRFQHRPFHEELFRQLRFTKQEAESTADGLDLRTLELPPGLSGVLPLLRNWKVMRAIIALRMLPLLTLPSSVSVGKSGAIAVLSVPRYFVDEPHDPAKIFCTGGRAIQRLWLAGTAADLSLHPLGSISIFLLDENPKPAYVATVQRARAGVHELLPQLEGRVIQLALRVGRSKPPSMRSIRRKQQALLLQQHKGSL
jgi:hypothetical protein